MNTITIQGTQLPVIEFRDQRVVTYEMIDEVHGRPAGTAKDAYQRNKGRFVEGEDTYLIEYSEKNVLRSDYITVPTRGIRVFTETGYLMLIKVFGDDLSWHAQRELVRSYFRQHHQHHQPLSEIEMIAAMAADAVRQQKRISHVEEKVEEVADLVDNIARGATPPGWSGYSELKAQCGLSDSKCRQLVSAYDIDHKPIPFIAPGGTKSTMTIVREQPFMTAFSKMMAEAEPRGTRWYHSKMGLFQVIGWEGAE
jgi:hypothetical protein